MSVSLKSLIGKLNDTCRNALEAAAGLCLTRTHYDVDIEHLLLKLSEVPDTDLQRILRHYEIDPARLSRDLTRALDRLKTGNARTPALSPRIPRLISEAWTMASIDFDAAQDPLGPSPVGTADNDDLARLGTRESRRNCKRFLSKSCTSICLIWWLARERTNAEAHSLGLPRWPSPGALGISKTPALDQYTIDLTRPGAAGGDRSGAGPGLRDPAAHRHPHAAASEQPDSHRRGRA